MGGAHHRRHPVVVDLAGALDGEAHLVAERLVALGCGGERGPEGAFRQRREISEPPKGNAQTPSPVGLRPTRLAKFEMGLSANALNPSGASILDLKQRTGPSNEKAGG